MGENCEIAGQNGRVTGNLGTAAYKNAVFTKSLQNDFEGKIVDRAKKYASVEVCKLNFGRGGKMGKFEKCT